MELISSFDLLAQKLGDADQAQTVSNDAFRQSLSAWYLSPDLFGPIEQNPQSEAYRAYQHSIYEKLTSQTYSVANEETEFDFELEIRRPYPYSTHSASTIGDHLIGFGWLIKLIDLPAGAKVLEIGSGYGSLTVHLSQMGYDVTCLDISRSLLDFIEARTANFPEQVKTICADMAAVEWDEQYDVVIFNASFHHSLEHQAVLKRLDTALKPNGRIIFVAEPIVSARTKFVPYPWGIRLDGVSIWSIVKWGWMELGFRESYFIQMAKSAGWQLKRHNIGFSSYTDCWVASRAANSAPIPGWKSALCGYDFDLDSALIRQINRIKNVLP